MATTTVATPTPDARYHRRQPGEKYKRVIADLPEGLEARFREGAKARGMSLRAGLEKAVVNLVEYWRSQELDTLQQFAEELREGMEEAGVLDAEHQDQTDPNLSVS